ncbi:DUF4221 domain-containing protein [Algoriphagus halophytocola]|uniref:DUF4221 domain-containing protein n=1 Tax=Algoriphagus halophytocola TaxID=2991499 RepID=A0ABY6MGV3_9BACT|nr:MULTISPECIES: DUF4221 domain-containing protein [unclassified Algoriphagus]UZD21637.1 DUF4221 domain-containing protein [Algoriphagus sp. TR-M5]WBL42849.1 DUF4221 domain-containing protein [Algoriphagus sp. TR-M9]
MKRISYLVLAFCVFTACSSPSEKLVQKKSLAIEIDTVRVDSKDELLFLNYFLNVSSLDASGDYLYNFNMPQFRLEKINMETLELDSLIQLEKDGPNALQNFISTLKVLDHGGFLFYNGNTVVQLNEAGERTMNINLVQETWFNELIPEGKGVLGQSSGISSDGKLFSAFYGDPGIGTKPEGIAHIDLESKTGEIIPTEEFDYVAGSSLLLRLDGMIRGGSTALVFFNPEKDKIFMSSSSRNDFMSYDLAADSLMEKQYESALTSNAVETSDPVIVEDLEEFRRLGDEKDKEVVFGQWFLDQESGNRWRFSKEMDRILAEDSVIFKTVLTGIDKNYEMIGETELPVGFRFPYKAWVRKGMIYTFLNENDELAFIRIKPEF